MSTVNSQLQEKLEQLENAANDMTNLFNSTDIATIFLDSKFCIKRYTPAATRVFNLIASDIGRPVGDISRKVDDPDLLDDARQVLKDLQPQEKEVGAGDGQWCIRRIMPYRTVDDRIEGVVVTFVDITERKHGEDELQRFSHDLEDRIRERTGQLEQANRQLQADLEERRRAAQALQDSEARFRAVAETSNEAIVSIDHADKITYCNPAAERTFGHRCQDLIGKSVTVLMPARYHKSFSQGLARYLATG